MCECEFNSCALGHILNEGHIAQLVSPISVQGQPMFFSYTISIFINRKTARYVMGVYISIRYHSVQALASGVLAKLIQTDFLDCCTQWAQTHLSFGSLPPPLLSLRLAQVPLLSATVELAWHVGLRRACRWRWCRECPGWVAHCRSVQQPWRRDSCLPFVRGQEIGFCRERKLLNADKYRSTKIFQTFIKKKHLIKKNMHPPHIFYAPSITVCICECDA